MGKTQYNNVPGGKNGVDTTKSDFSTFKDPYEPCVTDVNWLYSYTKENVLGMVDPRQKSYTLDMFFRDFISAMNYYTMVARRTAEQPILFIRTIEIPIMPEAYLEDGELGRCGVVVLPKNLLSIVRVEYSKDMHNYRHLDQVQHNSINKHQCCGHHMSEAWDAPCNQCDPCVTCEKTYIRENDCVVLPYKICTSGMLRITYKMGATLHFETNDDGTINTNFDVPPVMFDVIAHYCARRHLKRGGKTDRSLDEDLVRFETEFIEHVRMGDEEEEDTSL